MRSDSPHPDAFTRLGQELAAARALFASPPKPLAACLMAAAQKRKETME